MFNIITITGPSGSGKSEILKLISGIDSQYVVVPKYTTRARRKDDDDSIINVDKLPDNCDYRYTQYGEEYGFSLGALHEYISQGKIPMIVVNDEETLRKLHTKFGDNVKSYFVHRGKPSLDKLISICNSRGVTDPDVINARYQVANNIYGMYTNNIGLFDSIILNIGSLEETNRIVEQIVNEDGITTKRHIMPQGNKVYVIAGNAGSGKDVIVRVANKIGCVTIPKHTSRPRNPNDGDEMICPGDEGFNLDGCELKYENFNNTYGIEVSRILKNYIFGNQNQVLSCSNVKTIAELKRLFGEAVVPIYIHSDISPEEYVEAEKQEGSNMEYIQNRVDGFRNAHRDYVSNFGLYDKCLIYANDERELLRQFAGVLGIRVNPQIRENKQLEDK